MPIRSRRAVGGKVDFCRDLAVPRGYGDLGVTGMDEMPPVEEHVVPSTARPGGFGEHPLPMVATGICVRRLPITPESLHAAKRG